MALKGGDGGETMYGFVGLGQMGRPMARNLARGCKVLAFDTQAALIEEDGSIRQVGRLEGLRPCGCVFLSLPSDEVVQNVLFGDDGLVPHLAPGTVVVDTGTSGYEPTLAIARRLDDAGLRFVDAPVSGMEARAVDGTLTMMCGGDVELVEHLREPCGAMASVILHMGAVGSGQLMKLVNQLLFDINLAALAEVLPVAAKLGLDPSKVAEVVNSSSGRSFASEAFVPAILAQDFGNGYPMAAAYKDLVAGAELSARRCIPMPLLAVATAIYQRALLEGHGDKDKGAMILPAEELIGARFREQPPKP